MKIYQIIFAAILSLLVFAVFPACESGTDAVDTTGLSQTTLRIEGMT